MRNRKSFYLVLSAMFLALGLVLPFLTGQIPQIGNMLLPMHLPVLLCGLLCPWQYGLAVGFILPLMRSLIFSMPVLYPNAVAMAFELCTYGFLIGFLYRLFKKDNLIFLYISLVCAMLGGRAVWGVVQVILLGISGEGFTFAAFWAGAFTTAIPGIVIQLVLIPAIMLALKKTRIPLPKRKEREGNNEA